MCLFGSFGNAITWWYMFMRKTAKRTFKKESYIKGLTILSSLLIADTIACCICLPMQAIWIFNYELLVSCTFGGASFYLCFLTVWASSLSICVIAFERFVLITRFQEYNHIITFDRIKIILTTCWLIALVGPGTKFIPGGGPTIFAPINACMLALPILTIPFFYYYIVKTVNTTEKKLLQALSASEHRSSHTAKNNASTLRQTTQYCRQVKKVSKKCSLLISNFFFCSITCFILTIIVTINTKKKFMETYTVHLITRFAFTGLTMNSCMNPVIFVMRDSKFKAALRQSFFGKRQKRVLPLPQDIKKFVSVIKS